MGTWRCPNKWLCKCPKTRVTLLSNTKYLQKGKPLRWKLDVPSFKQKVREGRGDEDGKVALVTILPPADPVGEGDFRIYYSLVAPQAGNIARGTASIPLTGQANWLVYTGVLELPLEDSTGGQSADQMLVAYVSLSGWQDSNLAGWLIQKGSPAFWKTEAPIYSTPTHIYQFDTYSKWATFPRRKTRGQTTAGEWREDKGGGGGGRGGQGIAGSQWKRVGVENRFEKVG